MAQALVIPWAQANAALEFYCFTPSQVRAKELALKVGGHFVRDLDSLKEMDFYFIACKPQQFFSLCEDLQKNGVIVHSALSIMAAIDISTMKKKWPMAAIARLMPNTPNQVGKGVNLYFSERAFSAKWGESLKRDFNSFSTLYEMERESQLQDLTLFSASSPAFVFEMARILAEELVRMGFGENFSKDLVARTFRGAAELMLQSEDSFRTLKEKVTSKGGVTFEVLDQLSSGGFEEHLLKGLQRARERGALIAKSLE